MIVTGIIAEYNPFHNGHIYHINKAKDITKADVMIGVISGNFTQRGEASIIDKFEKTNAALTNGLDLVVELPYIYTVQNASVFGSKSVEILNMLKVNNIVFGSETNNLKELQKFAEYNIEIDHLKEIMDKGMSFPKSYGLLAGSLYPNDILAISYLRAIKNTNIKPISIQRTNSYHGEEINNIASAKAIRLAIKNGNDYSSATPIKIDNPIYNDDLYPYLQKTLMTRSKEELKNIFLVSEGIENMLIKNSYLYNTYDEFINNSVSKRYTRSRINRICLNIMNNITKDDVRNLSKMNYIRVLGFNDKGQNYLKTIKKDENINLITQFKNIPNDYKDIEWKINNLYATLTKDRLAYIEKELKGPIINNKNKID